MKLTVLTKSGEGTLYLRNSLVITEPSEIILNSATMYWNYNNINTSNDFITVNGAKVTLEHGYWNFNNLKQKLSDSGVNIVEKTPTGKCKITADHATNFKNLGLLLGLQKNTELTPTTTSSNSVSSPSPAVITSPNMVDINYGLRRVDIQCDIIDKCSNINIDGQPSDILTSIPIPTDKTLKGSLCYYNGINTSVKISRGTYNSIGFKVFGNNERYVCDVLLELQISKVVYSKSATVGCR